MFEPGSSSMAQSYGRWERHSFSLIKYLPKMVLAGRNRAQVRVLRVCGRFSRDKINHSCISFLSRGINALPGTALPPPPDLPSLHEGRGESAMEVPKSECEQVT